jgi:hypothetical protein
MKIAKGEADEIEEPSEESKLELETADHEDEPESSEDKE